MYHSLLHLPPVRDVMGPSLLSGTAKSETLLGTEELVEGAGGCEAAG
jgi:hypothetical protein